MEHILYKHSKTGSGRRFTIAMIAENNIAKIGVSVCYKHDTFCKKTGREIALARARQAREKATDKGLFTETTIPVRLASTDKLDSTSIKHAYELLKKFELDFIENNY